MNIGDHAVQLQIQHKEERERRDEAQRVDLPTYLKDLGGDPSCGNLHLSTYLR